MRQQDAAFRVFGWYRNSRYLVRSIDMERTLILLKPDTVHRGLAGQVISRIEDKGFQLIGLKLVQLDRSKAEELYAPHKGKGFFEPVVEYMTSGPIVAMVVGGKDVIKSMRVLMGAT